MFQVADCRGVNSLAKSMCGVLNLQSYDFNDCRSCRIMYVGHDEVARELRCDDKVADGLPQDRSLYGQQWHH